MFTGKFHGLGFNIFDFDTITFADSPEEFPASSIRPYVCYCYPLPKTRPASHYHHQYLLHRNFHGSTQSIVINVTHIITGLEIPYTPCYLFCCNFRTNMNGGQQRFANGRCSRRLPRRLTGRTGARREVRYRVTLSPNDTSRRLIVVPDFQTDRAIIPRRYLSTTCS